jgi:hypothetical protein
MKVGTPAGGKDHRAIHDALIKEIHKALYEMADFHKKVVNPDWDLMTMIQRETPFEAKTKQKVRRKA